LPVVVLLSALATLATVDKGYGMLFMSRYLAWLAVPAFALAGTALAAGIRRLEHARQPREHAHPAAVEDVRRQRADARLATTVEQARQSWEHRGLAAMVAVGALLAAVAL